MVKDYSKFRLLNKLRYYAFDWDDNILHMPTKIQMDKLEEMCGMHNWVPLSVTPAQFAIYRSNENYRIRDNDPSKAFLEFKDVGPRGKSAFIKDSKFAIDNKNYGPSWDTFIQCLVEASIFSIITARGHEYDSIKDGVKYVIDNCLTNEEKNKMYFNCMEYASIFEKGRVFKRDKKVFSENELINLYLDCCKYYGVGVPYSESFKKEFNLGNDVSIEECKQIALGKFIEICNLYGKNANLNVSIGFSDDDKRNVEHIKRYFEKKSSDHINLKFNVYDTSDKTKGSRTKFVNGVKEDMGSDLGNRQANLLRFDAFNGQNTIQQGTTNDFTGYSNNQKVKIANKLYKNTFKASKPTKIKKKKVIKKEAE